MPGSSVGIATELRVGRSGIESRWGRDFPLIQTGPGAHPASCKIGTWSFPGVKCSRGVLLTSHPLLVPWSYIYIYIYIYIYKEGKIFTARYTPCAITLEHRVVTWNI